MLILSLPCFASNTWWIGWWRTPTEIADTIAGKANEGATNIQDTKLDMINNSTKLAANGSRKYQIANTLNWLIKDENWISAYLQWTLFIGLVGATILLIWNGTMLVTGQGKINEVKEKIKNIVLWVIIMTSFVAIIKIVSMLLNYFFG